MERRWRKEWKEWRAGACLGGLGMEKSASRSAECLDDVMETDMDDYYYCDDADLSTEGFSLGSFDGHGGGVGRRNSRREEARGLSMTSPYIFPPRPPQDIPSKRKRNPSLKEAAAITAITVSSGSQESSAAPLQSPNPQRSPGIVLGVEEPKPSSPGVTFSDTPSVVPENSRNGRAGGVVSSVMEAKTLWEGRYVMKERKSSKTTFQGRVYNFLERPTGWKCFLYHFSVARRHYIGDVVPRVTTSGTVVPRVTTSRARRHYIGDGMALHSLEDKFCSCGNTAAQECRHPVIRTLCQACCVGDSSHVRTGALRRVGSLLLLHQDLGKSVTVALH
ncbi:Potassium voltage-gated channel subfamily KQT member 1 [Chionoecetes opilio]|uniref:Potassium voltage-gated channel subfamily KQT member 1 n=1 Tax=Chionoecetes opilio TaxID=41210 RepID=A0A8J4XTM6_CHIOP|nr:Potassium voltage-gated channel subfamily KQT member 1 [Chionoecetes opilio]